MALLYCIKCSYLGTSRFVICDLNTRYEKIQELVSKTFEIGEECIPAIQFSDGTGYFFNKDLFENYLILFPQPKQKFFVRLDCSKIIKNRKVYSQVKCLPFEIDKNYNNKRSRRDIEGIDDAEIREATPVRRQNCFIGCLPGEESTPDEIEEITEPQPKKRVRLMKSVKKTTKKTAKTPQPKRAFRM